MKISVEYSENQPATVTVENAEYVTDYKIEVSFSDGLKSIVNFLPFLEKSNHPDINKYLDLKLFKEFKISEGNLNWNDFDLIFPISSLRSGNL